MQHPTHVPRLTLAHYKLLSIIQRDQPALTRHHTHLSNLINVHQRIAVQPPKRATTQPFFQRLQVLRRQIALFTGDDPHQIAVLLGRPAPLPGPAGSTLHPLSPQS